MLPPDHQGRILRHRLPKVALPLSGGTADRSGKWLVKYNERRPHSGRYCYGKTPMQTFRETLHITVEKTIKAHYLSDGVQFILSVTD